MCLLDDSGVEVEVWEEFIRSWKTYVLAVWSVYNGSVESIDEHVFVHVDASPTSSLVEGLEVLATVKQTVEIHHVFNHFVVVGCIQHSMIEFSFLVCVEELFDHNLKTENKILI